MLEDNDDGQLEDIDVIPNEEMLLVQEKTKIFTNFFLPLLKKFLFDMQVSIFSFFITATLF